jgi:hypothetical protein
LCLFLIRAALPTDQFGVPLPPNMPPPAFFAKDARPDNSWNLFLNRILWAHAWREFVEVQASEHQINEGLDILTAQCIISGGCAHNIPWKNAVMRCHKEGVLLLSR